MLLKNEFKIVQIYIFSEKNIFEHNNITTQFVVGLFLRQRFYLDPQQTVQKMFYKI